MRLQCVARHKGVSLMQAMQDVASLSTSLSALSLELASSQQLSDCMKASDQDHQMELANKQGKMSSLLVDMKKMSAALVTAKETEKGLRSKLEEAQGRLDATQQEASDLKGRIAILQQSKEEAQKQVPDYTSIKARTPFLKYLVVRFLNQWPVSLCQEVLRQNGNTHVLLSISHEDIWPNISHDPACHSHSLMHTPTCREYDYNSVTALQGISITRALKSLDPFFMVARSIIKS